MAIEKIDQSIYFHSWINNTNHSLLDMLKNLINKGECIIFYRPRGPIVTNTDSNVSSEIAINQEKVVLSQGGIESSITQVILLPNKVEKHLIPLYCSQDQTCFSLFYGKEIFKNLDALSQWTAANFFQKKKSEHAYNLINLMENPPIPHAESLSIERLEEIKQYINTYSLLNKTQIRNSIFPKKYLKTYTENLTFDSILTITPISGLNFYVIKTAKLLALIGENELLAFMNFQPKEQLTQNNKEENGMLSQTFFGESHKNTVKAPNEDLKEEAIPHLLSTNETRDISTLTPALFVSDSSKSDSSKAENTKKRQHWQITDGPTESTISKYLKTTNQT